MMNIMRMLDILFIRHIRCQGTYEECEREMKKEIQKLIDDLELVDNDICDNVIDTGIEWEVFDIVEIKK